MSYTLDYVYYKKIKIKGIQMSKIHVLKNPRAAYIYRQLLITNIYFRWKSISKLYNSYKNILQ